jgi:hypothetical protein
VLSEDEALLADLTGRLASAAGGCVVPLSGGLRVLSLRGPRVPELLARLGGCPAPRLGEARRGRFADVAVLAACVRTDEVLLAVERAYAEHLLGWIHVTVAELAGG